MVGYSANPLSVKLGIRADSQLLVLRAPASWSMDLPPGVVMRRRVHEVSGAPDVVVVFCPHIDVLRRGIDGWSRLVYPHGNLWIAWPKKTSQVITDMTDHAVRELVLPLGLVDNKVVSIDDIWTGLRLVWRRENRP